MHTQAAYNSERISLLSANFSNADFPLSKDSGYNSENIDENIKNIGMNPNNNPNNPVNSMGGIKNIIFIIKLSK